MRIARVALHALCSERATLVRSTWLWRIIDRYAQTSTIRHMLSATHHAKVLRLARRAQGVTAAEIAVAGIHRQALTRLVQARQLERVARGLYRLPEHQFTEHHGLVLASARVPQGVICLLSALQFHGIGTQLPAEVWIAIDRRAHRPAMTYPPLRVVRFSGTALTQGLQTHRLEGQAVRVYTVAKTVADCFKYRNKIGLDVALEALHEAWRARRFSMDEMDRCARICRVQRVMQPYLEGMVA
jgi:predicted transcriptional regulator of viral defense system